MQTCRGMRGCRRVGHGLMQMSRDMGGCSCVGTSVDVGV